MALNFPKKVTVVEVGLRDGLQNECTLIDTEQKLELIKAVIHSGVKAVEVGSFVRADKVPQMSDSGKLFMEVSGWDVPGIDFFALIPNYRGLENAIANGCKDVKIGVSASRIHNMRNYNRTPEESIAAFESIFKAAAENGVKVTGTVQMAFGSPWEGEIPVENVLSIAEIYDRYGIKRIGLGDTASMASPNGVYRVCSAIRNRFPEMEIKAHFHNARGLGLCNIMAAMEAGVTEFDGSFAGLGGCPFVPNAAGNVSTEDIVNLMNELGVETGIDIKQTVAIGHWVEELVGHQGNSFILRAGTSQDLHESAR